jgi:hypothetical protein
MQHLVLVRTSRHSEHHRAHPFGARHAALLTILFGMAVFARADIAIPVNTRVPGFLVLAAIMLWLLLGSLRQRHF